GIVGLDRHLRSCPGSERLRAAGRQLRQVRQARRRFECIECAGRSQSGRARAGSDAMKRDLAALSSREQEQGVVIVAVLWILMALSALASVFSIYLSASARALAVDDAALQTEALVSASVELSAYQLALAGDQQRPPRGSFHFRLDDAEVSVDFTSEAARIDLNLSSKE